VANQQENAYYKEEQGPDYAELQNATDDGELLCLLRSQPKLIARRFGPFSHSFRAAPNGS